MERAFLLIFVTYAMVIPLWSQSAQCSDLKIIAPEYFDPWDSRSFSANTSTGEPVMADWTIVTENYRSKQVEVKTILNKESVQPQLWNSNDSGIVTAIATATSASGCRMTAAVHTMVVERAGSPLIIDEYGKMSRNDERGRLDAAIGAMNTRPKYNLLVYLYFRPTDQPAARRLRMTQILNHVVGFRKFDAKRVLFLVSESDRTYLRLQAASRIETETVSSFLEYLIVPAEQFADYKKLFQ